MSRKTSIKRLAMRFSDGGAQPLAEPTTPAQPGTTPTVAAQTQSTAVQVDMSQIEQKAQERAERAAQAVVKDMLKQSGLDDAAIQSMLAEYKAKQVTPEQTIAQLIKERDDGFAERDAKLTAFERREILRGHGLTDAEEIEIMSIRIDRLVTEGKDFTAAAQEYFTANPRPTKAPATVVPGVTGSTPLVEQTNSLDAYKKLSPQDKIKFKQENPTLYEQFKKALGF